YGQSGCRWFPRREATGESGDPHRKNLPINREPPRRNDENRKQQQGKQAYQEAVYLSAHQQDAEPQAEQYGDRLCGANLLQKRKCHASISLVCELASNVHRDAHSLSVTLELR